MKKQAITHASIPSAATNAHLKGLQQYFTPEPWAAALGAALPQHRQAIADLHCGNGSLIRGLANDTTRSAMGLDLDPAATTGGPKTWSACHPQLPTPLTTTAHGDVLDLLPLLLETETRFDLLALNPPFSLNWPVKLLPEPLRKGLTGKSIDSTRATLRMIPPLLSDNGEAILIGNANTLNRLKAACPQDFSQVWLHLELPSFFPGVDTSLRIGVLYFTNCEPPDKHRISHSIPAAITPDELALELDTLRRRHFFGNCIEQPWQCERGILRDFQACADEMERRRDPHSSRANVTVGTDGLIHTWVSRFQESSVAVPEGLATFLRSINRKHPLEITIQRGARMALQAALDCGIWTIDPRADDTIRQAIADFDRDRAPLTPVSDIQRIGWIDDAEELLCTLDFLHFRAGQRYPISSETIEWKKTEERPRYHAGKRDKEQVLVRGTDLRLTIHHPEYDKVHFIYNPDNVKTLKTTYSLEELAAHFALPEVPDITTLHPEQFATHLSLLAELETLCPT